MSRQKCSPDLPPVLVARAAVGPGEGLLLVGVVLGQHRAADGRGVVADAPVPPAGGGGDLGAAARLQRHLLQPPAREEVLEWIVVWRSGFQCSMAHKSSNFGTKMPKIVEN